MKNIRQSEFIIKRINGRLPVRRAAAQFTAPGSLWPQDRAAPSLDLIAPRSGVPWLTLIHESRSLHRYLCETVPQSASITTMRPTRERHAPRSALASSQRVCQVVSICIAFYFLYLLLISQVFLNTQPDSTPGKTFFACCCHVPAL
jgi:hypothetical protein